MKQEENKSVGGDALVDILVRGAATWRILQPALR